MTYTFPEKLNKKQNGELYAIEEALTVTDGVYDGALAHDNAVVTSVQVYTGPKLTGVKVANVILSIPADTPWKRQIKIFASAPVVYVSYETPGDTVEAEDINLLQAGLADTRNELDLFRSDGVIDGGAFKEGE